MWRSVISRSVGVARAGRVRARRAALIPDADEPRPAAIVQEIPVREIEALDVDDADEHALAVVVLRGAVDAAVGRRRRTRTPIGDDRRRRLQRLGHLEIRDVFVRRDRRELTERHLRFDNTALPARRPVDDRPRRRRITQVHEHVGQERARHALQGRRLGPPAQRFDRDRHRALAAHDRHVSRHLARFHRQPGAPLRADDVHLSVAIGDHAELRLKLLQRGRLDRGRHRGILWRKARDGVLQC